MFLRDHGLDVGDVAGDEDGVDAAVGVAGEEGGPETEGAVTMVRIHNAYLLTIDLIIGERCCYCS